VPSTRCQMPGARRQAPGAGAPGGGGRWSICSLWSQCGLWKEVPVAKEPGAPRTEGTSGAPKLGRTMAGRGRHRALTAVHGPSGRRHPPVSGSAQQGAPVRRCHVRPSRKLHDPHDVAEPRQVMAQVLGGYTAETAKPPNREVGKTDLRCGHLLSPTARATLLG